MKKSEIDLEKQNEELFWSKLEELDPFLFELRVFLKEYQIHPAIIPKILRHLLIVDSGSGFHTIEIIMKEHKLKIIKGAYTDLVDLPIKMV